MRSALFLSLAFVAMALLGCSTTPAATPTPTPSPQEITQKTGEAMSDLESLHFVIERDGAPAYIDSAQTLIFRQAEGDFLMPDRMQATIKVLTAGFVAEVQTVAIGQKQWMTNLLTGKWEALPQGWGLNPGAFFDPEVGIPPLVQNDLSNVALDGPISVDWLETAVWHVTATTGGDRIEAMSGGLIPPEQVELDIWIDPLSLLIHRIRLLLPNTDTTEPMEWTLTFGQFDQPVKIDKP